MEKFIMNEIRKRKAEEFKFKQLLKKGKKKTGLNFWLRILKRNEFSTKQLLEIGDAANYYVIWKVIVEKDKFSIEDLKQIDKKIKTSRSPVIALNTLRSLMK